MYKLQHTCGTHTQRLMTRRRTSFTAGRGEDESFIQPFKVKLKTPPQNTCSASDNTHTSSSEWCRRQMLHHHSWFDPYLLTTRPRYPTTGSCPSCIATEPTGTDGLRSSSHIVCRFGPLHSAQRGWLIICQPLWGMRPACQQQAQCFTAQRWRLESKADTAALQAGTEDGWNWEGSKGERVVSPGSPSAGESYHPLCFAVTMAIWGMMDPGGLFHALPLAQRPEVP